MSLELHAKGWFRVYRIIFDSYWSKAMGPHALAVYMDLLYHYNTNLEIAWPSQATIAKELGMSVKTVRKGIQKLVALNIIEVEKSQFNRSGWEHNQYRFNATPKFWNREERNRLVARPTVPSVRESDASIYRPEAPLNKNEFTKTNEKRDSYESQSFLGMENLDNIQ